MPVAATAVALVWALASAGELGAAQATVARTDRNYDSCLPLIANGGWCEMRVPGREPSIGAVFAALPKSLEWGRQDSILMAWGGAAYDARERVMYFTGGGHADYGGNEVISFDLEAGKWERLTEPSPLDHLSLDWGSTNGYIWIPDTRKVPGSAHSYDGLVFRPSTRTILYNSRRTANGGKARGVDRTHPNFIENGAAPGQYEFNPSASETRNGIPPRSWRKLGSEGIDYPRSIIKPDGTIALGNPSAMYALEFAPDGRIAGRREILRYAYLGDGNAVYDGQRDIIWIIGVHSLDGYRKRKRIYQVSTHGISSKALALDTAGNPTIWDGCTRVATYTPATGAWDVADWGEAGPTACSSRNPKVYSKWVHVGDDVFAGISTVKHGMWLYRKGVPPPGASRGR